MKKKLGWAAVCVVAMAGSGVFAQTAPSSRPQSFPIDPVKQAEERAQKEKAYSRVSERSPEVVRVEGIGPDVISLVIEAQETVRSSVTPYVKKAGDEVREKKWPDGVMKWAELFRDGKRVGRLMGKKLDWFVTYEQLRGDPLLEWLADDAGVYSVTVGGQAVKVEQVWRKSLPTDVVLPGGQYPTRHRVYLKLSSRVEAGKTYSIKIDKLNVKNPTVSFVADWGKTLSEAVKVNQIGLRPDDPHKRAFLSVWLGTGGAYSYPDGMTFSVVQEGSGKKVFEGKVEKALAADGAEQLWTKPPKNYNGTAVYRMDFAEVKEPGTYRVVVEGVGCSYPFEIGEKVWERAFKVQMKGLYNQRSGIELKKPYASFDRPRDFHPEDGATAIRSKYDPIERGNHKYTEIREAATGELVKNAWGGYHDAGDWNPRRVTHMWTTLAQLEVCELFPKYFLGMDLTIPKLEGDLAGVPDILNEAMFEVDCFRRLQWENGAMPWGIETEGDPLVGEVSWLSTQQLYVVDPTLRDSWMYSATAARLALLLKPMKPELAKVYEESAARAFAWAEGEYARKLAAKEEMPQAKFWDAVDCRNLSSLILYRLTGDSKYHEVFKASTALGKKTDIAAWGTHHQSDAAFMYARMTEVKADEKLRGLAKAAIVELADRSLKYAAGNAYNVTQRERGRPMFAGFWSTSGGAELVRAHYLTKKKEYLAGAVASCQFQSGCNPQNLVYTTGLGSNPVTVPLELDARSSGQAVPVGLTVFGNTDYFNFPNSFWDVNIRFVNKPEFIWPNAYDWPPTEAYFQGWALASQNEYVIDTWWPNVLLWGYLAGRP